VRWLTRLTNAQHFVWGGGRGWAGRLIVIGLDVVLFAVGIPILLLFGDIPTLIWAALWLIAVLSLIVWLAESSPGWKQRYPAKPGR